jgi:hypothetical protein
MLESLMEKHIGYKLPEPETGSQEEMQSQQLVHVYSVFGQRHGAHPAKHIYDEKILGYGW